MAIDWALTWTGISAVSAAIQALKAAIDAGNTTKEELNKIVTDAEKKSAQKKDDAKKAAQDLRIDSFDEDMQKIITEKIKSAKSNWKKALMDCADLPEAALATDKLRSEVCGTLRTIKQINGGVLPVSWYKLWTDNQCA